MEKKLFRKLGIPQTMIYGYIGLIIFMLGAAIESTWFSAYLVDLGYEIRLVSLIFSLYGISVTIFSWISSFLVNRFSIRTVMLSATLIYIVSTVFLIIGVSANSIFLIGASYMIRGASYPLFAYSFLIWVALTADLVILGKAMSWFWLSFNLGMTIIGPIISSLFLEVIEPNILLLIGILLVILGTVFVFLFSRDKILTQKNGLPIFQEIKEGLTILAEFPRLIIAMLVKAINNIGQFGFVIMMPIYLIAHGFTLLQWSSIWAITYIMNSFAGLLFGSLGDQFGWRKIVMYFSGTLTALSCILILLSNRFFPGNYFVLLSAFLVFAFGIAAFGPLSAIVPSMVPERKSTAISVLNLGSGLSNFIGPIIVTIFFQRFGGEVVLTIFAILYLCASGIAVFLKTPSDQKRKKI